MWVDTSHSSSLFSLPVFASTFLFWVFLFTQLINAFFLVFVVGKFHSLLISVSYTYLVLIVNKLPIKFVFPSNFDLADNLSYKISSVKTHTRILLTYSFKIRTFNHFKMNLANSLLEVPLINFTVKMFQL